MFFGQILVENLKKQEFVSILDMPSLIPFLCCPFLPECWAVPQAKILSVHKCEPVISVLLDKAIEHSLSLIL